MHKRSSEDEIEKLQILRSTEEWIFDGAIEDWRSSHRHGDNSLTTLIVDFKLREEPCRMQRDTPAHNFEGHLPTRMSCGGHIFKHSPLQ